MDDKRNTPFHLIAALTHNQKKWRTVCPYGESGIYGLNKQKLSIANIRRGDFGEIQKPPKYIYVVVYIYSTNSYKLCGISVHEGKLLLIVLLVSVTVRKILEKEERLTKTTDENGWSPLHYVAYFSRWIDISAVKVLLKHDASAAYIAETTEKKRTALHIAAIQGHVDVMKEIVSRCPDCCELVDNRGWNALHYAVASQSNKAFKKCLRIPELERLKTEKDDKGNTPFHLIAALKHKQKEWRTVHPYGESGIYGLNKQKLGITNIHRGGFGEIQTSKIKSQVQTPKSSDRQLLRPILSDKMMNMLKTQVTKKESSMHTGNRRRLENYMSNFLSDMFIRHCIYISFLGSLSNKLPYNSTGIVIELTENCKGNLDSLSNHFRGMQKTNVQHSFCEDCISDVSYLWPSKSDSFLHKAYSNAPWRNSEANQNSTHI
uniref:Uncharacterized protein n=1 Tax=Salix viminalis TaxID=40686 RepID=A0A6N2LV21_SALVM